MDKKSSYQGKDRRNLPLFACLMVAAVIVFTSLAVAFSRHNSQSPAETDLPVPSQSDTGATVERPFAGDFLLQCSLETGSVTLADAVTFTGTADPEKILTVNGENVPHDSDGSFAYQVQLNPGENRLTVNYDGEEQTFLFQRRYVVESFTPSETQSFPSGTSIPFAVSARDGSTVTVELHGKTLVLQKGNKESSTAPGFFLYTGEYVLPTGNTKDVDLGKAVITAVCDGVTETYQSDKLVCLKAKTPEPTDPPKPTEPPIIAQGNGYLDVGTEYVAEVVNYAAETFRGETRDDYSYPTNNYLPKGTVDYCYPKTVSNTDGTYNYYVLRSGQRVYVAKRNPPGSNNLKVAVFRKGQLPDHNAIHVNGWSQSGNATILTLDSLWKAPFYLNIGPQSYAAPNGGSQRSYAITSFTVNHVDIRFCYATEFTGSVELPADNPLFKSAEIIRNKADTTLRLYLRKTGGFYGWRAYYNESNQLCFRFLNPSKVQKADNPYGADLTGVKVMIDVGHGGYDCGAIGVDASGKKWMEADLNLMLSKAIQKELESIGAKVVLNRTEDVLMRPNDREIMLHRESPDICICIHQNSIEGYPGINGFMAYYYHPFSMPAAKYILKATKASSIYQKTGINWHRYYTARESVCPVVLMENGYVSNAKDLANMCNPEKIAVKAQATTQGIVNYFLSIQK